MVEANNVIVFDFYFKINRTYAKKSFCVIPFHEKPDTNTDPVETRYIASGTKFIWIVINVKWYKSYDYYKSLHYMGNNYYSSVILLFFA
ncbi:MAG: hypothetical protein C6Y22_18555 [Hapalosiphonaceae cyanobacterium JJU2]|nr:MAG: hypothetical protein C6Y22_18555 [Hapalosiphonaceae cyanobacterium JJU2]